MKERTAITIISAVLLFIVLLYFFYPLCGFHRVGTLYEGGTNDELCYCGLKGAECVISSVWAVGVDEEDLGSLFSYR